MRATLLGLTLMTAWASPAPAQVTAMQARAIRDKAPVFVVLDGETWTGRLVDMDAATVTILTQAEGPKTLALADVLRIDTQKWDSPFDGAFGGGMAMMAWGLCAGMTFGAEMTHKGRALLQMTAAGALLGFSIDAAHKSRVRLTLYERPSPVSMRTARGLFVTVRF